jgi:hypothetical protein
MLPVRPDVVLVLRCGARGHWCSLHLGGTGHMRLCLDERGVAAKGENGWGRGVGGRALLHDARVPAGVDVGRLVSAPRTAAATSVLLPRSPPHPGRTPRRSAALCTAPVGARWAAVQASLEETGAATRAVGGEGKRGRSQMQTSCVEPRSFFTGRTKIWCGKILFPLKLSRHRRNGAS